MESDHDQQDETIKKAPSLIWKSHYTTFPIIQQQHCFIIPYPKRRSLTHLHKGYRDEPLQYLSWARRLCWPWSLSRYFMLCMINKNRTAPCCTLDTDRICCTSYLLSVSESNTGMYMYLKSDSTLPNATIWQAWTPLWWSLENTLQLKAETIKATTVLEKDL